MSSNQFEKQTEKFINLLKETKIKGYFNVWNQTSEKDKLKNADEIRCNNLRNFLIDRENAEYIIIGEAPSYGARYTGIPMTSEENFNNHPEIFSKNRYKTTSLGINSETTASIVWDEILKSDKAGKNFVMWNAFAFHNSNEEYVQAPNITQLTCPENLKILKTFLNLFPNRKIIAMGRTTQETVGYALTEYVRHPSHGGEKSFREDLKSMIENKD